jgi:hypothetical protein
LLVKGSAFCRDIPVNLPEGLLNPQANPEQYLAVSQINASTADSITFFPKLALVYTTFFIFATIIFLTVQHSNRNKFPYINSGYFSNK